MSKPAAPAPASTSAAPVALPPKAKAVAGIPHDASRQARLLRDALSAGKTRIGFFLGAGCPLGIYDEKGEKSIGLLPDVFKLTSDLREKLVELDKADPKSELLPCWEELVGACKEGGENSPNIEHILTELRTFTARKSKAPFGPISKDRISGLDKKLCDLVMEAVGKPLPPYRCAYHRLASWIGGLNRPVSVDVFTPNYDLLMEEAFEIHKIPHFDGFVGSREPFFDIASIEQDAVPRRWARLWKLHGSINWQRKENGDVFRAQGRAEAGKAMIYPSHLKYDQSRRMPYLAMIDRFRAFFKGGDASRGLGPPVLIVSGYSFADDHLNEVLLDGLRGNPSAHCFALVYGSVEKSQRAVEYAQKQPNLTVLAWDGAVVGTRVGPYVAPGDSAVADEPWLHAETLDLGAGVTTQETRCRLGDFHFFGLFLERLYGRGEIETVVPTHA